MFSLNKSVSKLKALKDSKSEPKNDAIKDKEKKVVAKKKKKSKANKSAIQTTTKSERMSRGVIRVKNFPHGFYESQMFDFFGQFGKVLRIRIARSKKTGNHRNYGFIEFECEAVAKIAANTMNNYLMFDHILKCDFIPQEKVREMPHLFQRWNKQFVGSTKIHKSLHNKSKSLDREWRLTRKRLKNVRQMESFLKEKGLHFNCHIINLPDIKQLREESKLADENRAKQMAEIRMKLKPKATKASAKSETKATEPMETVVITKKGLTPKSDRRKRVLSPRFPRLLKYSILLSANKKKVLYSK